MKTKDFRALTPSAQEEVRKRAVQAVLSGQTQRAVARTTGVSEHAMSKWMKSYRLHGEAGLNANSRGRKKGGGRLSFEEGEQIAKTVVENTPEKVGIPGYWLWTRDAVGEFISMNYGVEYSRSSIGRLLRRHNLTPQKPAKRAIQQNPKAVKQWLEVDYPAIRKLAQAENAEIFWGDECGFRSDHQTGTTYGRRGQTPVIPRQGKRFSCNMISAISNYGSLYFRVFTCRFTSHVFIDFLRRLSRQIGQNGKKAFLIVDNHSAHKSKAVKKWLEKHHKEIRVYYLPGYSPEFNPDEYLNNDVKSNAVGRIHAADRDELENTVRSYLRSTQKYPNIVKAFFNADFVKYARV